MLTMRDVQVQAEYQDEFRRRAAQHRQKQLAQGHTLALHRVLLARVGAQLVAWGCALETRYGELAQSRVPCQQLQASDPMLR